VVVDVALGVGPAVAGVDAVPVEAGEGLETVVIRLTTDQDHGRIRLCAGDPGVSNVSRRAGTDRLVVLHLAEGVGGTGVCHRAGVETFPVDAGIVQRTFRVISTFRCQDWD